MGNALPEAQVQLPRDAEVPPTLNTESLAVPSENPAEARCSICLDVNAGFKLPCRHTFHAECLDQWFSVRPTCPDCNCAYGLRIGSMPDGDMCWHRNNTILPGYSCRTILMHFNFPAGTVDGRRHSGRSQHAYLPDDVQGRHLLALFKVAFRRRLLFSLDHSLTTGQYRPVFNIHLKTGTTGGPTRHGFPDPGYYQSALEELRAVGINATDASADGIDVGPMVRFIYSPINISDKVFRTARCICGARLLFSILDLDFIDVLLPIIAVIFALGSPTRISIFFCWFCLALVALQDELITALYVDGDARRRRRFRSWLAAGVIICAGLYSLARQLFQRRCNRLFRKVWSVVHRSYFLADAALCGGLIVVARGKESVYPFLYVAFLCLARGVWSDISALRMRRRHGHGGGRLTQLPSVSVAVARAPRFSRTYTPRRDRPEPIGDDDWAQFSTCPSLRGRLNAMQIHASIAPDDRPAQRVASVILRKMLQNESDIGEDYLVFYHSYNASCILYELQSALAHNLMDYPKKGPPVLRLLRARFRDVDSATSLLELRESYGTDHAREFRQVAISAFASCFASGGYGQSMLPRHFHRGYFGGRDLGDMSKLLEEVLFACGIREPLLSGVVTSVLQVGLKWGLDMSPYKDRGTNRLDRDEAPSCPGHIVQIFVHKSIVDSIAYGSLPLGRLAPGGLPASAWLAQQCPLDGQVRILMHPDVFLNTSSGLTHVFTHSGSFVYGQVQRERLLEDLDAVIAPLFSDAAARERARAGLGIGESQAASGIAESAALV